MLKFFFIIYNNRTDIFADVLDLKTDTFAILASYFIRFYCEAERKTTFTRLELIHVAVQPFTNNVFFKIHAFCVYFVHVHP